MAKKTKKEGKGADAEKGKAGASAGAGAGAKTDGAGAQATRQWPWHAAVKSWMGNPGIRKQMMAAFHDHYVHTDKGGYSRREWDRALASNAHALPNKEEEALVLLMAVGLAHEKSRRYAAEDVKAVASAIRFRHQGNHFQRMFSEVARWTAALDHPAAIKALLEFVVAKDSVLNQDTVQLFLTNNPITFGKAPAPAPAAPEEAAASEPAPASPADELIARNAIFRVLDEYLQANRWRLVDLFRTLDKDGSYTLTREEVVHGFQTLHIELSEEAIDQLLAHLDVNSDGVIVYSEMTKARRDSRANERMELKAAAQPANTADTKTVNAAATAEGSTSSAESPVSKELILKLDDLMDLLLHCHYVTRP